jgi:hypothetical protein
MKILGDIFEDWAKDFDFSNFGNPPEYPLLFPLTHGHLQIPNLERLQEAVKEFKAKWGGETSFEVNGKNVIIHNVNFQTFRDELQYKITQDYQEHRNRNFD